MILFIKIALVLTIGIIGVLNKIIRLLREGHKAILVILVLSIILIILILVGIILDILWLSILILELWSLILICNSSILEWEYEPSVAVLVLWPQLQDARESVPDGVEVWAELIGRIPPLLSLGEET